MLFTPQTQVKPVQDDNKALDEMIGAVQSIMQMKQQDEERNWTMLQRNEVLKQKEQEEMQNKFLVSHLSNLHGADRVNDLLKAGASPDMAGKLLSASAAEEQSQMLTQSTSQISNLLQSGKIRNYDEFNQVAIGLGLDPKSTKYIWDEHQQMLKASASGSGSGAAPVDKEKEMKISAAKANAQQVVRELEVNGHDVSNYPDVTESNATQWNAIASAANTQKGRVNAWKSDLSRWVRSATKATTSAYADKGEHEDELRPAITLEKDGIKILLQEDGTILQLNAKGNKYDEPSQEAIAKLGGTAYYSVNGYIKSLGAYRELLNRSHAELLQLRKQSQGTEAESFFGD